SAVTGEGKASTAVQLAKLSSLGGNRTLLIELDLLRPRASVMLDVANRIGIIDYLRGQKRLTRSRSLPRTFRTSASSRPEGSTITPPSTFFVIRRWTR
ncbi:MAG: hypothetical protein ACI81L_002682, partial [Verrucomicrobiales bacterium]